MTQDTIRIRHARTHNLKNIDVDIPRHQFVVITGLSGSGKSSLAFDTLYAEGQRRYAESVSSYARRFMDVLDKPDVDSIEGLSPSIAIQQHTSTPSSRSTVATVTEIADYLRLLFARAGVPYCPHHHRPLTRSGIHNMVDAAMQLKDGSKVMVLAPLCSHQEVDVDTIAEEMGRRGYVRLRVDGEVVPMDACASFPRKKVHTIEVVIDRLKISREAASRLADSFEVATKLTEGQASFVDMETGTESVFSLRYGCPECGYSQGELTPAMFSFNNALGACPTCEGAGWLERFDPKLVVRAPEVSIAEGAVCGYSRSNVVRYGELLHAATQAGFSLLTPWVELPEWARVFVLDGSQAAKTHGYEGEAVFTGVMTQLQEQWKKARSESTKIGMRALRSVGTCPDCGGARYRKEVHHVYIGEGDNRVNLLTFVDMTLTQASARLKSLTWSQERGIVAAGLIEEIHKRIGFLINVGLGYLTLSREAKTLSGGEMQRIRLAGQIGSGLTGVTYVLDEPTIGLHQADNDRLIDTMKALSRAGNTVIAVEHDADVMRAADFIVDMGPGAGELGGYVVAAGTPEEIMKVPASKTGAYLRGDKRIAIPSVPLDEPTTYALTLVGAKGHNLKNVTCSFPVGAISVVTGVSGSGKSTLINDTLSAALKKRYMRTKDVPLAYDTIQGAEYFDKIIEVDQSPIGKTPRSNPATYTGLFALIRDVFAQTLAAKERGYDSSRFSFNADGGGRCEACSGDGQLKIEMGFLPPVYVTCSTCQGRRYNRETLQVLYRGKSIADVLDMTVSEAKAFFASWPTILRKLETLEEVGLGYIRLGQSAVTFSGGEAQRMKLALELSRRDTGRTLYVLDEPTTGLHFDDVAALMQVLRRLTLLGNTVIVIEHNLDVIESADWIVDIGPLGGNQGGELVCQGTPETVAACPESLTGKYLKRVLSDSATKVKKKSRKNKSTT